MLALKIVRVCMWAKVRRMIYNDAKIWLEPEIEVARQGRTLRTHELNRALQVIRQNVAQKRGETRICLESFIVQSKFLRKVTTPDA
jgi:hypothetical protein